MMRMRGGHQAQARILVADWDPIHALSLSEIVQMMGYKVATAYSGEEAVELAPKFVPDLLISEVCMGGLSGVETAAQITRALPECRVLFLSGEATPTDVSTTSPETLVYSFTSKPVHPLDLLNVLAYTLSAEWSADDSALTAADHDTIATRSARRTEARDALNTRETRTEVRVTETLHASPGLL